MPIARRSNGRSQRRGQAAVITAVSGTMLISFAALAVDVGLLYNTRTELQRAADAAALAGAWNYIMDEERLEGDVGAAIAVDNSRAAIALMAARNTVLNDGLSIDLNGGNAVDGDIVFGLMSNPTDQTDVLVPATDSTTNAVRVLTRRDSTRNGQVPLLFAQIFGKSGTDVSTAATAAYEVGMSGYKIPPGSGGTADLLPFSVWLSSWEDLLDGTVTSGDNYAYDPETGTVSAGSDGINELNIYPGSGAGQLPPGNFGTVDIGNPNNSTADLARQILYGINESDLAFHGGELSFDASGVIQLHADTGLSAGMKDELAAIIGHPRAIPIFNAVTGNGNNAVFDVVRFGGIRIMDVKLTGKMSKKYLIIQPAIVVDEAVVPDASNPSDYVSAPPKLVR